MAVVRNNIGYICGKGAIYKLVVIMVGSNKPQMELWVDKLHELAFDNCVDHVLSNDRVGFAGIISRYSSNISFDTHNVNRPV